MREKLNCLEGKFSLSQEEFLSVDQLSDDRIPQSGFGLSTILQTLMKDVKINESELARKTSTGQPVVHRIRRGRTTNPTVGTLFPLAQYFGVTIGQLYGVEPLPAERIPGSYSINVKACQRIPLLDWQQVLTWPNLSNTSTKRLPTLLTDVDVGHKGYAVEVVDTTMDPRFPEGTRLLINREVTPRNRDFVVVHIEGESMPHFKQLLIDGNTYYLKPFNPDFRAFQLDKPYRFLGVMVQAQWIPVEHTMSTQDQE